MKNPVIAFILNLIFFGGGYVYNGKRIGFGCALILSWILIRLGEIPIYLTHLVFDKWLIMFGGIVVLQFNFAIDAYKEAKIMNKEAKL